MWSEFEVVLKRPIDFKDIGACEYKFLSDSDAKGYLLTARKLRAWAEGKSPARRADSLELCDALERVAKFEQEVIDVCFYLAPIFSNTAAGRNER